MIRELKEELGIVVNEACLAPLTFASHAYPDFHLLMPLYRVPALGGDGDGAGRPEARLGAAEPAAGLSDAARRRAAGLPSDDAVVNHEWKVRSGKHHVRQNQASRHHCAHAPAPRRRRAGRDRDRICADRRRHRRRRRRDGLCAWAPPPRTSTPASRRCSEQGQRRVSNRETADYCRCLSPAGISLVPSASASRRCAEPGASGFCWLSCGAQPDSQTISKVARMRPSGSAKRSP